MWYTHQPEMLSPPGTSPSQSLQGWAPAGGSLGTKHVGLSNGEIRPRLKRLKGAPQTIGKP